MQSAPAQLRASDPSATLRAIVVDGAEPSDSGASRARSIRWFFCDESHTNDPQGCARSPSAHATLGDGESVVVERSAINGQRTVLVALCPGAAASFNPTAAIIDCPDERGRAWSETEGVLAFYTVKLAADGQAPNEAPAIEQLSINGDASAVITVDRCASEPCATTQWAITPTATSAERVGDAREVLTASFFATEGSFDRPRAITTASSDGRDGTLSAKWTPPRLAQRVRAWVVLRDDRGASAVIERTIEVR
ncbi:MAG: hypothetical protein U0269_15805 [Polyangiales bacterium]